MLQKMAGNSKYKSAFYVQVMLRILAIAFTAAAASLMLTNNQTKLVFDIQMDARYTYSPSFKFLAFGNVVGVALSVSSLAVYVICTGITGRKAVDPTYYFYFFLHDLIVTVLLATAFAAATAVGYIGKYGSSHSGWMPICDHFGKFCNRAISSSIFGFLGFITYLILTVVSANKSRQIGAN